MDLRAYEGYPAVRIVSKATAAGSTNVADTLRVHPMTTYGSGGHSWLRRQRFIHGVPRRRLFGRELASAHLCRRAPEDARRLRPCRPSVRNRRRRYCAAAPESAAAVARILVGSTPSPQPNVGDEQHGFAERLFNDEIVRRWKPNFDGAAWVTQAALLYPAAAA